MSFTYSGLASGIPQPAIPDVVLIEFSFLPAHERANRNDLFVGLQRPSAYLDYMRLLAD